MNPNQIQQVLQSLMQQQNPVAKNLAQLINSQDYAGIEMLARNLMESQGKDFDKEFSSFKQRMGFSK